MKKLLATIMMITCIFALTACGGSSNSALSSDETANYQYQAYVCYAMISQDMDEAARDQIRDYSERDWSSIEDNFATNYYLYVDGATFLNGLESWWSSVDEMNGEPVHSDDYASYKVSKGNDTVTVTIPVTGNDRNGKLEIAFDDEMTVTSITATANYTMGEKMGKAALNTLMGMGTVFIVLILISLIIYCFGFIPKLQNSLKKKGSADVKADAVNNTIAQIIEKEEIELADDLELVAVISAAVAASEGAASTDGFVVRSIKRRR